MRYFKYKNTNKNYHNAFKAQYKLLTKDEKKTVRKERRWHRFSMIVTLVLFLICMSAGICLIKWIPQPAGWFWRFLVFLVKVIMGIILLAVSWIIISGLTLPLWKKVRSFQLPAMKKEILSNACSHLRAYYKLQQPYIITKCYSASDKAFNNHDVCLFIADGELRITTDLIRGFLHGWKDLGCYAFTAHEITLSKRQKKNLLIAELKSDDTVFLLGYRAKSFIEKNFLAKRRD